MTNFSLHRTPDVLMPNRACERFKKRLPLYNVVTSFLFVIFILCLALGLVH